MSNPPSISVPPEEGPKPSSSLVFSITCLLLLATFLFPAAPLEWLQGGLLGCFGLLMLARPPRVSLPGWMFWSGILFLLLSAAPFLPKAWFSIPEWRQSLETAGLDTGPHIASHHQQALWQWGQLAALIIIAIYLLGHRVTDHLQMRFAWLFSFAVTITAALSMALQATGTPWPFDEDPSFGFFPNRNHMATLLAMGTLTSLGCMFQAVRSKRYNWSALASLNCCVCIAALLAFCHSRAGLILLAISGLIWIICLGKRYFSKSAGLAALLLLRSQAACFLC
jgi:hypothetical protein